MPYLLIIIAIFFFASCSDNTQQTDNVEITVSSIDDLSKVFNDLNYTSQHWNNGIKEIPRIHLLSISPAWQETSKSIPVKQKKDIFFRLLTPLVLIANEEISKERSRLLKEGANSSWARQLARKYKLIKEEEPSLPEEKFDELLQRVDTIPVSLALAQGAVESGWGTSRFAAKGNALFGQWDFSGEGMVPQEQRKNLGNYGLARFDSPLDSVKAYMHNLNTSYAYENLRTLRYEIRQKNEKPTGLELATTLHKYSEKGEEYIENLYEMIRYNRLQEKDKTYLSQGPEIYITAKQ